MKVINVRHPYYCSEGNYYKAGEHERIGSWGEFINDYGELDEDLNHIWRWDYSEDRSTITFFFMLQRKARCRSVEVLITDSDEPAVVDFLKGKWKHVKTMWAPFGDAAAPEMLEALELSTLLLRRELAALDANASYAIETINTQIARNDAAIAKARGEK